MFNVRILAFTLAIPLDIGTFTEKMSNFDVVRSDILGDLCGCDTKMLKRWLSSCTFAPAVRTSGRLISQAGSFTAYYYSCCDITHFVISSNKE